MAEKTIQELIRDKKVEMFDLQLMIGTLQQQMQQRMAELNELILKAKQVNGG